MEEIKNRFTGEIICGGLSLEVVLERHKEWAMGSREGERADLRGVDLMASDLTGIKDDFFNRLKLARNEVVGLYDYIVRGKIDGGCYEGDYAVFAGHDEVRQAHKTGILKGLDVVHVLLEEWSEAQK